MYNYYNVIDISDNNESIYCGYFKNEAIIEKNESSTSNKYLKIINVGTDETPSTKLYTSKEIAQIKKGS
tara:strand:+ start:398 stop:604 length:207 start_codon:yes stop_codon:yes gene_type:complete